MAWTFTRSALAAAALIFVSACNTLPRAGPTIDEITAQPVDGSPAIEIIPITDNIGRITRLDESLTFSPAFLNASVENIELIRPLDVLNITIWESGEFPLYGGGQGGPALLTEMRVGLDGNFFMPQVGTIRAAGKTIEACAAS